MTAHPRAPPGALGKLQPLPRCGIERPQSLGVLASANVLVAEHDDEADISSDNPRLDHSGANFNGGRVALFSAAFSLLPFSEAPLVWRSMAQPPARTANSLPIALA